MLATCLSIQKASYKQVRLRYYFISSIYKLVYHHSSSLNYFCIVLNPIDFFGFNSSLLNALNLLIVFRRVQCVKSASDCGCGIYIATTLCHPLIAHVFISRENLLISQDIHEINRLVNPLKSIGFHAFCAYSLKDFTR